MNERSLFQSRSGHPIELSYCKAQITNVFSGRLLAVKCTCLAVSGPRQVRDFHLVLLTLPWGVQSLGQAVCLRVLPQILQEEEDFCQAWRKVRLPTSPRSASCSRSTVYSTDCLKCSGIQTKNLCYIFCSVWQKMNTSTSNIDLHLTSKIQGSLSPKFPLLPWLGTCLWQEMRYTDRRPRRPGSLWTLKQGSQTLQ